MALKGQVKFKGLQIDGAYTRVERINLSFSQEKPSVSVSLQDFANEAVAERVLDEITEVETPNYDPSNSEHITQYEAAGSPDLSELDANGNPWKPTIYVKRFEWRGRRKESPIQERQLDLPVELVLAVLSASLQGEAPDGKVDNVIAVQTYLALSQLPEFKDAVPI